MASSSLLTTTPSSSSSKASLLPTSSTAAAAAATPPPTTTTRRTLLSTSLASITLSTTSLLLLHPVPSARAENQEYVRYTSEIISKLRTTVSMPKSDPNLADAVTDLRESSNSWVAKFRKEKSLLGRASYRDVYSALNAVSGHFISFGPTAPIPAKRKARILEEVDSAEKALLRGR